MEAIGIALNIVQTLYKLYDAKTTADSRIKEMLERVYSLDQPLQVLKKQCRNPKAYEVSLNRLVDVLQQVEKFLKSIQSTSVFNQAKRWTLGDAQLKAMAHLNGLLNNSLMDLQTAIQAEESERSEARIMETAMAAVNIIAEAERQRLQEIIRVCVHCGQEYRESSNAEGSCKYHKTIPVGNWKYTVNCCGRQLGSYDEGFQDSEGCVRGKHRDKHHAEFPYASYFRWIGKEKENESEILLEVTQEDLEDEYEKKAIFGVRNDGTYFVRLSKGHFNLFLAHYTQEELQKMTSQNDIVLFASRGSDHLPGEFDVSTADKKWFLNAYWNLKDGKITGITLTAKSLSKSIPNSKTAYFDPSTLPSLLETKVVFDDSVSNKNQDIELPEFYIPPKISKFTPFPEHVFKTRTTKSDFPTEVLGNVKLRIKQASKVEANPNTSGSSSDAFVVTLMLLHHGQINVQGSTSQERLLILQMVKDGTISLDDGLKLLTVCENTSHSDHAYNIIAMKTEYQFEDETEWRPTEFDPVLEGGSIPLQVGPRGVAKIVLKASVQAKGKSSSWFNRAYVTRIKSIRFRVTFEEMGGAQISTIFEYANPATSFIEKTDKDIFFLNLDSIADWDRLYWNVQQPAPGSEYLFKIQKPNSYCEVTAKQLRLWAYNAKKAGQQEFLLDVGNDFHKAYALVDLDSSIVYGFKFVLRNDAGEEASDTFVLPREYLQI